LNHATKTKCLIALPGTVVNFLGKVILLAPYPSWKIQHCWGLLHEVGWTNF